MKGADSGWFRSRRGLRMTTVSMPLSRTESDRGPFHRILLATDLSEGAARAFEWAALLASRHDAMLEIVHAIDVGSGSRSIPLAILDRVAGGLADLERTARERGAEVRSRHRRGRSWEVILEAAETSGADLIVVGSRGTTPYSAVRLGSTADRIVRMSPTPVLTVHGDDTWRDGAKRSCTILVATDFSPETYAAAATALRLGYGGTHRCRLVLVHAWYPVGAFATDGAEGMLSLAAWPEAEAAGEELERFAAIYRDRGVEVETIVRAGYPATVIETAASEVGADLIALGTHGRTGLARLMIGSVAERVLHHARCPVLTTRRLVEEVRDDAILPASSAMPAG